MLINVPKMQVRYPEIPIVEDNCEGFLGKYNGKPTGKF
jgi:dTDP-4-amino-4,6-dideoxygalactose transaminase